MMSVHPRMTRERITIKTMITIYCKNHHESDGKLCPEFKELFDYAMMRLEKVSLPREENNMCQMSDTLL